MNEDDFEFLDLDTMLGAFGVGPHLNMLRADDQKKVPVIVNGRLTTLGRFGDMNKKSANTAPLKVGDRVRLNQHGAAQIGRPTTSAMWNAMRGILIVTDVSDYEPTPGVWDIDVAGPLSGFMLTSADVDKLPS